METQADTIDRCVVRGPTSRSHAPAPMAADSDEAEEGTVTTVATGDADTGTTTTEAGMEQVLTVRGTGDPELWYWMSGSNADFPSSVMSISLWVTDEAGNANPQLAEDWEVSEDLTSWTIHLKDWVWSDGVPVTSEDVKFSIEEVLLPFNPWGTAFWSDLDTIETPDPSTVVITLKQPFDLTLPLSHEFGTIVPKHVFEGTDILATLAEPDPVVAGPYLVSTHVAGSSFDS